MASTNDAKANLSDRTQPFDGITHHLAHANLDVLDSATQPINPVFKLPDVPLDELLVLRQAVLHPLDCLLQVLQRSACPPLFLLETFQRLLETGSGGVQSGQCAQTREDVGYMREERRQAGEHGRELLLQGSRGCRGCRRGGRGRRRRDSWRGGPGVVCAASLCAMVCLTIARVGALELGVEELDAPGDGVDVAGLCEEGELRVQARQEGQKGRRKG